MNEESIAKKFGNHLRQLRKEKGYSQEKLAFEAGLHPTYISMIETGKKQPSLSTLVSIARSLDVKLGELVAPFD